MTESGATPAGGSAYLGQLMSDALFLRQFVAQRGLYKKELLDANKALMRAIEEAEGEVQAGRVTADHESNVLTAMGDVLRELKCTRINDLRRADTVQFRTALSLGRIFVFATMLLCITLALPLTLVFNQLTTFNKEIEAATDPLKASRHVGNIAEREVTSFRISRLLYDFQGVYGDGPGLPDTVVAAGGPEDGDERRRRWQAEYQTTTSKSGELSLSVELQLVEWEALKRPPTLIAPLFGLVEGLVGDRWGVPSRPLAEAPRPGGEPPRPGLEQVGLQGVEPAKEVATYVAAIAKNRRTGEALTYLLNNGVLPLLYGMLGAAVFLSRRYMATTSELWASNPLTDALMRVGLGGMAGLIVGWFQTPDGVRELTTTPFALAFIAGFSIDIVFSLLERIVAAFDFRKPA